MILAIDPGNVESGYALLDDNLKPIEKGKIQNEELRFKLQQDMFEGEVTDIAIEMIASYGMPVGVEVFETCIWIGRFLQTIKTFYYGEGINIKYIYRKDEKMNLCHSMKANDATIKQALVDRFAPGQSNYGKGTKKEPGWFYGFKADIWQAYAVAVTYNDMYLGGNKNEI